MNSRYTYAIDKNDLITEVSDAWLEFAVSNGADNLRREDVVGRSLWDFLSSRDTVNLYGQLLSKVRETGETISIPFRCDSPKLRRFMQITISPAEDGGLQLCSELVSEEEREHQQLMDANAPGDGDLLKMCSWCKQIELEPGRWVEVEEAVSELRLFEQSSIPAISHGVCPGCFEQLVKSIRARE